VLAVIFSMVAMLENQSGKFGKEIDREEKRNNESF
jgi:hypothetical protein